MSGERFLDDLARTLAEPMPRRRALRLLGTSLAAVVVPGGGARMARAATTARSETCDSDERICHWDDDDDYRTPEKFYCCGPSAHIECGPVGGPGGGTCVNNCPSFNPVSKKSQYTCTADKPEAPPGTPGERASWKKGSCCVRPEWKGCFPDGSCKPNCSLRGRGYFECGKDCCPPGMECKGEKCVPCPGESCTPARGGAARCCPKGTRCCFNNTSTACCGPEQTCHAAKPGRPATCTCNRGADEKCGSDCCGKSETCCEGKDCCAPGETCTQGGCCPKGRAVCRSRDRGKTICCAKGEFCFWKVEDEFVPLVGTCKRACAPGNRCGTQCCGAGYGCKKGACVPE